MENDQTQKKKLHSEEYFGEQSNFWWNPDFISLMSERWNLKHVQGGNNFPLNFNYYKVLF